MEKSCLTVELSLTIPRGPHVHFLWLIDVPFTPSVQKVADYFHLIQMAVVVELTAQLQQLLTK
jgi:hypothetical protein